MRFDVRWGATKSLQVKVGKPACGVNFFRLHKECTP